MDRAKEGPHISEKLLKEPPTRGEMRSLISVIADAVSTLTLRVNALEQRGTKFCGVWQKALAYRPGEVVVSDGSGWIAVADSPPGVVPAKDLSRWQLFEKAAQASALKTLDLKLDKQVKAAQAAAAKAVEVSARIAARSAEAASDAARNKRLVERVVVTRHDEKGRVAEFEKRLIEDAEQ